VSSKKEQRERVGPLAKATFPILDEYEEANWEWSETGKDPLEEQAGAARDANYMAKLLLASDNDIAVLPDVIQVWYESRRKPFDARGDEDRASHFLRSFLGLMNSYGNMFGCFPETSSGVQTSEGCRGSEAWVEAVNRQPPQTTWKPSRAELLQVLMLPDFERAERIGEFWGYPEGRTFAELLIDCEEDRTLRAELVGMPREAER
jgi:hypothetical protein